MKKIYLDSEKRRIYTYMIGSVLSTILAFLTNWLITKYVTPSSFGLYKYATNFLLSVPALFEFGIHFSGSRLIAEKDTDEKDGIVFTSAIVVLLIGIILTMFFSLATILSNDNWIIFESSMEMNIIYPFIMIFTLRILVLQLYQGMGKTNQLALLNLFQYIILIAGLLIGKKIFGSIEFEFVILLFIFSNFIVMVPFLLRMKYTLVGFKNNLSLLYKETKSNGFYVYLGTVVTNISTNIIGLISGSIYGFEEYAYYSLAISFAQVFTVLSSTMATVKFKNNVTQKFIPSNDLKFMLWANVLIYGIFLVTIRPVFMLFFSSDYIATVDYLIILGIVYSFNGIILYFNRFFVARGRGAVTTRNSLFTASIKILASIILIPEFKIKGIVYAALISSFLSLINYIYSYRVYLVDLQKKGEF